MTLFYLTGDALEGPRTGPVIIAHVTNDSWGWGNGFVVPLGKKYPKAEQEYRGTKPVLGITQFVAVERLVVVANMCAQQGYKSTYNPVPLDYDALEGCLRQVGTQALIHEGATGYPVNIHMPRIGAGRGGGSWPRIEGIINERLVGLDLDVTVYDLPEAESQK
jgi:hypothetical protein